MKLVLFDIDGTLLRSKGLGSAATELAMQEIFGTVGTLAQFTFGGKTDWQMLLETLAGLVSPSEIERRLDEYDRALDRYMSQLAPHYEVKPCAGAPTLLERCFDQPDFTVGILTANMPSGARVKLEAAGYDPQVFHLGVYGSEAPTRQALSPIALTRAESLRQRRYSPDEVLIIGDTPEDIACAHHIGARVLAVATGRFSREELANHQPTYVADNLAATEQMWSWLMA